MFRIIWTLAIAIMLGGCATVPDVNRQRLDAMPQHYAQFDAVVGWEVVAEGPRTIINGEFQNIRYLHMDNVEIWVAALDARGKPVARAVSYFIPHQLDYGQVRPFTLKLPVSVAPGAKLRFSYKYSGLDGASSEGGGDFGAWRQSFEAEVPAR
jgi:hypothetical protein